jgi:UPF0755 protein
MRRVVLALVAVAVLAAVAAAAYLHSTLGEPYRGYEAAEIFVDIPPGSGTATIGRRLVESGVVRDTVTWRLVLLESGAARELKAGEYRFAGALTPRQVVATLARGDVHVRSITFPEGLTIREMARLFEQKGYGRADDFEAAARNVSLVKAWDPGARDLEGYLFPETYALTRHTDAATLVRQMVARFDQVFPQAARTAAEASGRPVREIVTLASLVEKETAKDEERALVAAVYRNRLAIGMGLQCDPTVIYALRKAGKYDGNLTRENMLIDSPYNTYRYAGLPPGPIAAPGRASIEAALNPGAVDYLYFVSRNDGSHVFSKSYEEHARHVRDFQGRQSRDRRGNGGAHAR